MTSFTFSLEQLRSAPPAGYRGRDLVHWCIGAELDALQPLLEGYNNPADISALTEAPLME